MTSRLPWALLGFCFIGIGALRAEDAKVEEEDRSNQDDEAESVRGLDGGVERRRILERLYEREAFDGIGPSHLSRRRRNEASARNRAASSWWAGP